MWLSGKPLAFPDLCRFVVSHRLSMMHEVFPVLHKSSVFFSIHALLLSSKLLLLVFVHLHFLQFIHFSVLSTNIRVQHERVHLNQWLSG